MHVHRLAVVHDGRVVAGNLLDGVVVIARSVVADCLEGNVAVLVIRDGLNGRAFRLVTLVQSEREVAPCELTAREVLLRLERYRGPLRVVRVRDLGDFVSDLDRVVLMAHAVVGVGLLHLDCRLRQRAVAVIAHRHRDAVGSA